MRYRTDITIGRLCKLKLTDAYRLETARNVHRASKFLRLCRKSGLPDKTKS